MNEHISENEILIDQNLSQTDETVSEQKIREEVSHYLKSLSENSEREIFKILTALVFSSKEPISVDKIYRVMKHDFPLNKTDITHLLERLAAKYNQLDLGFELTFLAEGYVFRTLSDLSLWVGKIHNEYRKEKLSKAAIETLAVIAYKQPITRSEIEEIRGVNIEGAMKVLLEKGLIVAEGKKDVPGKPWLYVTTKDFLIHFGLKSLKELPSMDVGLN